MKRNVEDVFVELRELQNVYSAPVCKSARHRASFSGIWAPQNDSSAGGVRATRASCGISKISRSLESVSAVSSSDFTIESLEEGEIGDEGNTFNTCATAVGNRCDDLDDVEKHISLSKRNASKLRSVTRLICAHGITNGLCTTLLGVVKDCHQTISFLASVRMILLKSDQELSVLRRINDCFKEQYNAVVAFKVGILGMQTYDAVKCLLASAPYSLDMLVTVLPCVVASCKEQKQQQELIILFRSLVNATLLRFCGLVDHFEDDLRMGAVQSIFHIVTTLLPIKPTFSDDCVNDSYSNERRPKEVQKLSELLWDEYIQGTSFKPSSLFLFQLHRSLGMKGVDHLPWTASAASVLESAAEIGSLAVQTGCTKRHFPVGYMDSSHCSLKNVSDVLKSSKNRLPRENCAESLKCGDMETARLWSKAKYWLLQLLEDNNAHIRNVALKIIRHAMVTVHFIEKERQHIMSLVTDCISDDATFDSAMAALVAISHLYPLKDGAVRRISNLTLKGDGLYVRLEILRYLGDCYYTPKGLDAILNVLQKLCEPMGSDDAKSFNMYCATSTVFNFDSEMLFLHSEWPTILNTLIRVRDKHIYVAPSIRTTRMAQSIRMNAPNWIRALWAYLSDVESKRNLLTAFCRSEASLRYPGIVDVKSKMKEYNHLLEANKISAEFLVCHRNAISVESLHNNDAFLHIHRHRVKGGILDIRKFIDSCHAEYAMECHNESGRKCHCIDCAMDKMVMSPRYKRSIPNIYDDSECLTYAAAHDTTCNNAPDERTNVEEFILSRKRGEAVVGYYRKYKIVTKEYLAIDDVDCISFPSHLGVSKTVTFRVPASKGNVTWFIVSPYVLGSCEHARRLSSSFKGRHVSSFDALLNVHFTQHTPTVYPVPVSLRPMIFEDMSTVSSTLYNFILPIGYRAC